MDFGKIINNSFNIAWKHKSLWLLGLFSEGSYSAYYIHKEDLNLENIFDFEAFGISNDIMDILPSFEVLFVPIMLAFFTFMLLLFIMHLIAVPGLIDGINKITRGGFYTLAGSINVGLHNFWRFFGLFLLLFITNFIAIVSLVLVGVVFFLIHVALGILSLLVLIPLLFLVIMTTTNIYSLTQRAIVVRDTTIGNALEEAFLLFRKNLLNNLLIFLIFLGLSIGLGLAAFIIWLIVSLPLGMIVMAMGLKLIPAMIVGIILGLPVSLVVGGFLGVVFNSLYTLFYFELVEPGGRQTVAPAVPSGP